MQSNSKVIECFKRCTNAPTYSPSTGQNCEPILRSIFNLNFALEDKNEALQQYCSLSNKSTPKLSNTSKKIQTIDKQKG